MERPAPKAAPDLEDIARDRARPLAEPAPRLHASPRHPTQAPAPLHRGAGACEAGTKTVSLALQGGGAHGAFTWGVLDELLRDGRVRFKAISAASAGAINAVALVDGWMEDGADGARAQLERVWRAVAVDGAFSGGMRSIADFWLGPWRQLFGFGGTAFDIVSRSLASPYDFNPLNYNPLREVLSREVDFERLRSCGTFDLSISATNVETGRIRIFKGPEIAVEHVLASACLPFLFQAVEIEGTPYWDGGYTGNPALFPLFYGVEEDDVLLVQINPTARPGTPRDPHEIQERINEITANAGLVDELRAVAFVQKLIDTGRLSRDEYKRVRMHRIDGDATLLRHGARTKLDRNYSFFEELREGGREAARRFLDAHFDDLGVRDTLDIASAVR